MGVARLANPLFGVAARTERGRQQLTAEALQPWVRLWLPEPDPDAWWIDAERGVAFFRPDLVIDDRTGAAAVLCIRGAVVRGGRAAPPRSWPALPPATGMAAILYDVIERDHRALRDVRGQFAMACWDGRRERLLLARDHLGQRGLFTRRTPELMVFSSELAPLLRAPEQGCDLDPEGAFHYLAFGMAPPGQTLARHVDRVPAAHAVHWEPDAGAAVAQRYWTPLRAGAPREATPDLVAEIRRRLDAAVAAHLTADEPQGLFLSGGVDSTYLAATARMHGVRPIAFTSVFDEAYGMNETPYAQAVADWLDLPLHQSKLTGRDAAEYMEAVLLPAAEPCSAWATLTHFRILIDAHQAHVSRMMSGLGADEVFGGYDHFRGFYARFLRYAARRPAPEGGDDFDAVLLPEQQEARRVLYPGVARFFDDPALRRALHEPYRRWHYASHLRSFYRECRRLKPEAQVMEMMVAHECQHRIPDLLFANFEAVSRRMNVEVSYPFLDPDVVELACGLSTESRYRTASGSFSLRLRDLLPGFKHAMMQVAADRVPAEIRERPRKSFTAPFGPWLYDSDFAAPLLARLHHSRFWERGIVRREWLSEIESALQPGPNPAAFQLWALVTLAGWYDRFVDAPNLVEV